MTHAVTPAVRTPTGWKADCTCGFRTRHGWNTAARAEDRVQSHIQLSTDNPGHQERQRKPITIEQAATGFLRSLLWALDESTPASRGGWPL